MTNPDRSTPENDRTSHHSPHHDELAGDECPCEDCQGNTCEECGAPLQEGELGKCWVCEDPEIPDQDREPTDREISRMMDQPDEAERRAEMTRVYFDLK